MAGNDVQKAMRKIFTDNIYGSRAILTGDKHNHLAFSLRVRPGDKVVLCNDCIDYEAQVVSVTKNQTELEILSQKECSGEPSIDVTLFFAILKGDKNDLVAQKVTELGVKRIVPFYSNNCECRRESFKVDRVNRIVVEAAEQCGRGVIPVVESLAEVKDVCSRIKDFDLVIFANEREKLTGLKDVKILPDVHKSIAVIIGSEGGFTKDEGENFTSAGAKSITLGPRILRAETANIAVVSAVMYEGGQWQIK